ncbi:MAG: hypothetical protein D6702_02485 [Planctomycetota bacterium]|nr:MAG: hypothetical protein D6702_02485 [Planctomycetota bacterium]
MSLLLATLAVPLLLAPPQEPVRPARPRAGLGGGFPAAGPRAGGWHHGDNLVCSDCHTTHNSLHGQPMRYDGVAEPADNLLRMGSPTELCLYCHDGTDPAAPDVLEPVSYVADPAGGWFTGGAGVPNDHGHDLRPASPLQAPGSSESFSLECSSCHDVHGNSNYRNLLFDPPGSADNGNVVVVVDELVSANGSNPAQVYVPANLKDRSGMGEFCNSCHDNFHGKTAGEEGGASRPWLRHPNEETIFGKDHADYSHWAGPITNRVRVETPTDDIVPSSDDRVTCLSCHKAHGSGRVDSLIYADGLRRLSTCQQCHNQ